MIEKLYFKYIFLIKHGLIYGMGTPDIHMTKKSDCCGGRDVESELKEVQMTSMEMMEL